MELTFCLSGGRGGRSGGATEMRGGGGVRRESCRQREREREREVEKDRGLSKREKEGERERESLLHQRGLCEGSGPC